MTVLTDPIRQKLAGLSGLIPDDEGEHLATLASHVPTDLAIVEVGSFRGKSTAYLAAGAKAGLGAPVYAVDPWDLPGNPYGKHGYSAPVVREQFERQLRYARVWSHVTPIQAFSSDAAYNWTGPRVGLLFLDGDHSAEAIRADLDAWSIHLSPYPIVALDDIDTPRNPGVRQVADELAAGGWAVQIVVERLAVCVPPASA